MWDIKGKALGLPVWKLLGGAQNPVLAYITFGLPAYNKEQLGEAAKYWVQERGQDKLKMVVGVGGFTEAVKVAAMAQAFNMPIANGGAWPLHNMHLQAGMSSGWRVESHYLSWMMYEAVYQSTERPKNGWLTVPETPGLGLDPKPGIIQEYREAVG